MVRPGRLDKLLYVDLPTPPERVEILRALTQKSPLGDDVNLEEIGTSPGCDGFSGADLSALVREAAVTSLREVLDRAESLEANGEPPENEAVVVRMRHFVEAVRKTSPSVSVAQRKRFNHLRAKFAGMPVGHAKEREEVEPAPSAQGLEGSSGEAVMS